MPTLAGFIAWIRAVMGVSSSQLADNDPVIVMAFNVAVEIVNLDIQSVSPVMYPLAVYNLGGDNLVNYAQDATDAPKYEGDLPFWQYMRKQFNTYGFVSGVVQSSSDVSTSNSMVVQDAARDFTLSNLQNLKSPWGRNYLAIAQRSGTLWGLS